MELIWIALGCAAVFAVDYVTARIAGRNGHRRRPMQDAAHDFEKLVTTTNAIGKLFDEKFASVVSAQLGGTELVAALRSWKGESIRVDDLGNRYIQVGEKQVHPTQLSAIAVDLQRKVECLASEAARIQALEQTWSTQAFSEALTTVSDKAQAMLLSTMKLGYLLDIENPAMTREQLDELCQAA